MSDILQQPIAVQLLVLIVLSAVVACVAWTVTHEEVFREPREYCLRKSKEGKSLVTRKFFYVFTCEYCFSHYVTALIIGGTGYRLLLNDWRGFIVAGFTMVWIANFQMGAFARIRLEVRLDRLEVKDKIDTDGADAAAGGTGGTTKPAANVSPKSAAPASR
jgi:hypothetical protein